MSRRQDWYYWRLPATGLSFILFGIGGLVLGYLLFPLISLLSANSRLATRRCRRLVQWCFRVFLGFMSITGVLTWQVTGRELLNRPGQLIVANHPTLIDIVLLISMVPNASCIVKSELYRNFFTRGPVRRAAYVANDNPQYLIDDCVRELRTGASLIIFPEGTRSVAGLPGPFRRGAAYVLLQAACPYLLAAIDASPPTLSKQEKWYQIPRRRPHFQVSISEGKSVNIDTDSAGEAIAARELTRQWREHFVNEAGT